MKNSTPIYMAYLEYVHNYDARKLKPLSFEDWILRHWGTDPNKRSQYADLENFWEVNEMISSLIKVTR